jgi:hypothetical protein
LRLREALAGASSWLDASAGEGRSAENATTQEERERLPIQLNRKTLQTRRRFAASIDYAARSP